MVGIVRREIVSLHTGPVVPCVSVIVPVFNEYATVQLALESILQEGTQKEVIIVDDGSDDGTGVVIERWVRSIAPLDEVTRRIVLVSHMENAGKGTAIRTALEIAQGQFVIVQDADLEVWPSCYVKLLDPLIKGTAEFVIGCRWRDVSGRLSLHAIGVAVLGMIIRTLYGYRIQDAACCFKVLSLENLRKMNLEADQFEFCPEVISKAARLGLTLQQVDVDYFPRSVDEGKKLRLIKDGIKAIRTLLRYRQWKPSSRCGCQAESSRVISFRTR